MARVQGQHLGRWIEGKGKLPFQSCPKNFKFRQGAGFNPLFSKQQFLDKTRQPRVFAKMPYHEVGTQLRFPFF